MTAVQPPLIVSSFMKILKRIIIKSLIPRPEKAKGSVSPRKVKRGARGE